MYYFTYKTTFSPYYYIIGWFFQLYNRIGQDNEESVYSLLSRLRSR